jgi:hypothetical protein
VKKKDGRFLIIQQEIPGDGRRGFGYERHFAEVNDARCIAGFKTGGTNEWLPIANGLGHSR